jgi:hypothetical protein
MKLRDEEPLKSKTLEAMTELVCRGATAPTPAQMNRGLGVVSGLMALERARRRKMIWASLAGMLVAAGAAGVLGIGSLSRARRASVVPPALTYRAEGGTVIDGGYLRELGKSGIKLSFSEGTKLVLAPGTHGRLRSVDAAGARIAIESGEALFQVTPRREAKWLVDVGPFLVSVTGTVFTVKWDISSERFELRLRNGRVTVSGPVSGGDIALRAGQRLVVDLPKSETVITDELPGEPPAEAETGSAASSTTRPAVTFPAERPALAPERTVRASGTGASAHPSAKIAAQSRWAEAVAAGDWDSILRDTERSGVRATLDKVTSEDLSAVADAARYRRRLTLARAALFAQRRRFSSSPRAIEAAYLLGRVEESRQHGVARALQWYDEYLALAPTGRYASEALGRKMILTGKLEGDSKARPLADEYLRRFPDGAYAGAAQSLRRAP